MRLVNVSVYISTQHEIQINKVSRYYPKSLLQNKHASHYPLRNRFDKHFWIMLHPQYRWTVVTCAVTFVVP